MSSDIPSPVAESLPQLVREANARLGDAPALSCILPNGWKAELSYRELDQQSDAFARYLHYEADVRPGDVVAIQAPNILAYPLALVGALKAGATVSGVNPLYTPRETKRQLEDCGAKVFVGFDVFGGQTDEVYADGIGAKLILASAADGFSWPRQQLINLLARRVKRVVPEIKTPFLTLGRALTRGAAFHHMTDELEAHGDQPTFLAYSGGTTGVPKGVVLTSRGLLTNIAQVQSLSPEALGKQGRTGLLILPLYHMYGVYMLATSLSTGSHLALAPSPRPLSNLKAAFEQTRPDVFPGVNTLFAGLLEEDWFTDELASSIELTFSGATSLSPAVAEKWRAKTKSEIIESYGMTEATTVLTTSPVGAQNKPGSCGVAIPGTTIRIVKDDGTVAKTGERGEVQAKGPQIMGGYFKAPDLTAAAFDDGWLKTGDVGILDEDGYLSIVDRVKDMILVSGFNVFPGEIEDVISSVPGVQEVGVVGIDDEKSGELPVAFVVKTDRSLSAETIAATCDAQLTNYKRPKEIRFVDALPKSPVGKVLRRELRSML